MSAFYEAWNARLAKEGYRLAKDTARCAHCGEDRICEAVTIAGRTRLHCNVCGKDTVIGEA